MNAVKVNKQQLISRNLNNCDYGLIPIQWDRLVYVTVNNGNNWILKVRFSNRIR